MPVIYTHLVSTLSTFYLVASATSMGLYFDEEGLIFTHLCAPDRHTLDIMMDSPWHAPSD